MRIMIQALIEGVEGGEPLTETIGAVERDADGAPASGLCLFLRETHGEGLEDRRLPHGLRQGAAGQPAPVLAVQRLRRQPEAHGRVVDRPHS